MASIGATTASLDTPARRAATEWLRRESRRVRGPALTAGFLTALFALALAAQAWVLSGILAAGVLRRTAPASLWPQWAWLLVLAFLRFGFSLGARRTALRAAQTLAGDLRVRLLRGVEALGPVGLRAQASGDLITRLVDGIDAVLAYFARYLPQIGSAVLVPCVVLACAFPVDWLSGLVLALTAPLIPLFMVLVGRAAGRASEQRHDQLRQLGVAFVDALGGLVTLRQLGAAERFAQRLEQENEAYRALTMQVLRVAFLSALVLEFFAMVSIAVVAVLIGFRLLWGDLPLRNGLFVLLVAPEFYLPLRALGGLRHVRMDALAAAQALASFDAGDVCGPARGGRVASRIDGGPPRLRIERVSYRHHGREHGLRDCDLSFEPRRVTTLVGETGSGKSTLLQLLMGFDAPQSGRILIDDVDLSTLDPAGWRDAVAWVPQQAHVFEGTVRDNLLLAMPTAGDSALRRAAERSGLDDVLARLPKGWDTPLGERGLGLSGGELQRLAIARALLRESARVWLLDEPTAHLDEDGARRIDGLIRAAATTRTVLVVAHRLSAARLADWVVVLGDGRVIEQGPPTALARAQGAYARLSSAERS